MVGGLTEGVNREVDIVSHPARTSIFAAPLSSFVAFEMHTVQIKSVFGGGSNDVAVAPERRSRTPKSHNNAESKYILARQEVFAQSSLRGWWVAPLPDGESTM